MPKNLLGSPVRHLLCLLNLDMPIVLSRTLFRLSMALSFICQPLPLPCQAYKKCSVCLGPSKVMGKIFCQICARRTHHKHIAWSPYKRGSGQGHFDALWCNLHLYLNLFCVNIIFFLIFEHFLRGQFFFWDRRSHGPVDFVGLSHVPPWTPCYTVSTYRIPIWWISLVHL